SRPRRAAWTISWPVAAKHALAELRADFHRIVYAESLAGPGRVHGLRAEVAAALRRRGPQPSGGRRGIAQLLPVPEEPMENAEDHKRDPAGARGRSPPREDPGQP